MQIEIIATGQTLPQHAFFELHPCIAFPQPLTDQALEPFGARLVPAPEPVPGACSRRQGRLALLTLGLLDDAEAAIAAIPDGNERRAAQIEYEADTWERDSPFVLQLWAQFGGTPESLDDAFRLAVTL